MQSELLWARRDKGKEHALGVSLLPLVRSALARGWFFARKIALMEHSVVSSCFLQLSCMAKEVGEMTLVKNRKAD